MARSTTSTGSGRRRPPRADGQAESAKSDEAAPQTVEARVQSEPPAPAAGDLAPPTEPPVTPETGDQPAVASEPVPAPDAAPTPVPDPTPAEPDEPLPDPATGPTPAAESPTRAPAAAGQDLPPVAAAPRPASEARPDPIPGRHPDAEPPPRRPGLLPPLMGGVLAAGLGAGVALWLTPGAIDPARMLAPIEARLATLESRSAAVFDPSGLESRLAALESLAETATPLGPGETGARLDELAARLAAIELRPAADPAGAPDLSDLTARLAALEAREPAGDDGPELAALVARLDALESRPPVDLTPFERRLATLEAALPGLVADSVARSVAQAVAEASAAERASLDAAARDLDDQAGQVAAARAQAEAVAALGELGLAADSGAPAGAALDRLSGAIDLPGALAPFRDGLPTLGALQAGFAPAARAALAAAPPPDEAGAGERLLNFLRSQTGARSLAPREGDDADAVLSRAEAAVRRGDLGAALAELDVLPAPAAAAMAGWIARARSRLDALAALDDLATRLGQP